MRNCNASQAISGVLGGFKCFKDAFCRMGDSVRRFAPAKRNVLAMGIAALGRMVPVTEP